MEQKRIDPRKAVLRAGRDATVLLAGILAGAVAAFGVAAPDDMHYPAQPPRVVNAPGVVTASTAALDSEVLWYVNRLAGARLTAMTMHERHAFAARQIAAAKALGMHSSQEIGIYAAMALKVGDDFLAQMPWQLALQQVTQRERSWVQVLTDGEPQR